MIPAFGRQRQEDHTKVKADVIYNVRSCHKAKQRRKGEEEEGRKGEIDEPKDLKVAGSGGRTFTGKYQNNLSRVSSC